MKSLSLCSRLLVASLMFVNLSAWAASPVVVDSTGRVVAFYLGRAGSNWALAVSTQGYMVSFRMETGEISLCPGDSARPGCGAYDDAIYFLESNCTGATMVRHFIDGPVARGGLVFRFAGDGALWSIGKNPSLSTAVPVSVRSASGLCENEIIPLPAGYGYTVVETNDPVRTGIPNESLPAPLRIEVAAVTDPSGLVARDGFEGAT